MVITPATEASSIPSLPFLFITSKPHSILTASLPNSTHSQTHKLLLLRFSVQFSFTHTPNSSLRMDLYITEYKPKSKSSSTQVMMVPPPRRGQIKMRIFKTIAAAFSGCGGSGRRLLQEDGADAPPVPLSSASTTPPIPSGYSSEA